MAPLAGRLDLNTPDPSEISHWLRAWSAGSESAADHVFEGVYRELREMARLRLDRERGAISFQATELVNELFLRLVHHKRVSWQDRNHFLAVSAMFMRRILVDFYRHRNRRKRGSSPTRLSLESWDGVPSVDDRDAVDVLALHEALERLERVDVSAARLVELRYFVGLSVEEAAESLSLGRSTATRRWFFARAWLKRELKASRFAAQERGRSSDH